MHKCISVHQIRLFWSRGELMRGGMHQCASDAKYIVVYCCSRSDGVEGEVEHGANSCDKISIFSAF